MRRSSRPPSKSEKAEESEKSEKLTSDDIKTYPGHWLTRSAAHQPRTTTLAILNTVERAQGLFVELESALRNRQKSRKKAVTSAPSVSNNPERLLIHSRFRAEIAALKKSAYIGPAVRAARYCHPGDQAGVDPTARVLFTELAPWPHDNASDVAIVTASSTRQKRRRSSGLTSRMSSRTPWRSLMPRGKLW